MVSTSLGRRAGAVAGPIQVRVPVRCCVVLRRDALCERRAGGRRCRPTRSMLSLTVSLIGSAVRAETGPVTWL